MVENTKIEFSYEKYDFKDDFTYALKSAKGLSEQVVRMISGQKNEPEWMLSRRLKALGHFNKRKMPAWGADLGGINFDDIHYYAKPDAPKASSWDMVPEQYKKTFDRLGIPESEKKFLAGVGAQYDSENILHTLNKSLVEKGVIFSDIETALREHPDLVEKYFGTIIPSNDNKFAALNTAVWSGGSFVYVPKGVHVDLPLQAYFRINASNVGQFERTLIIAEEGSAVHYVEGCFVKGTPITCSEGAKPIEDIKEGDLVLTHKGSFEKVYWTQVRPYSGNLFEISVWGEPSSKIRVTSEHPFYACKRSKAEYKNTSFSPSWVKADELEKFDYLAKPIDNRVESKEYRNFETTYKEKPLEIVLNTDADFFRLVGYYLSEGCTIGEHYLSFTFNIRERPLIEDTKKLLKRYFNKDPIEQSEYKGGVSLVLCYTPAARLFGRLFGNSSSSKRIPEWMSLEDPLKQKELIKGYWSGDGSYINKRFPYGRKNQFRMNTVSQKLSHQVQQILLRLGVFAGINVWKRRVNRRDCYCLNVGGRFVKPFAQLLGLQEVAVINGGELEFYEITEGSTSYAEISGGYLFLPIRSIEKVPVERLPVFNFGVEKDESYVAHGFAVHNCSAPIYSAASLHSAVVEIIAKPGSKVQYTTIQNWSNNVYNLVTKRAFAYKDASVFWLDCNIGSKVTMKYPSIYLLGENAKAEILSLAYAAKGQCQDSGGKAVHYAPNTTSIITSKSVCKDGGRASYRGLLKVAKGCENVKSNVRCDALILDENSRSDTYPTMEIEEERVSVGHEATVGKVGEEQLYYLMSRGLSENEALALLVLGFIEDFNKRLPMEYAIELNRLIELDMSGSVG